MAMFAQCEWPAMTRCSLFLQVRGLVPLVRRGTVATRERRRALVGLGNTLQLPVEALDQFRIGIRLILRVLKRALPGLSRLSGRLETQVAIPQVLPDRAVGS